MSSLEFDAQLKQVLSNLDQLPPKFEANLVRGALRAAAKPILQDARSEVPVQDGDLRRSIRITSAIKRREGEIVVSVKAGNKTAWYAHLVEFGTKAHEMVGRMVLGGRVYSRLHHPGASAKPFMRPAFDRAGQASVDAYGDYVRTNFDRVMAKAGGTT